MADPIDEMKPVHFENMEPVAPSPQIPAAKEEKVMAKKNNSLGLKVIFALLIVFAGIGTGYALNKFTVKGGSPGTAAVVPQNSNEVKAGDVFGSEDANKYKDNAEGVLVTGGIEGEGSHHLLREGGPARNVYMTSSILDLGVFEGAKVKVWGETFSSQKAGWLMDVGRVEIVELNAAKPFEEPGQTEVLENE